MLKIICSSKNFSLIPEHCSVISIYHPAVGIRLLWSINRISRFFFPLEFFFLPAKNIALVLNLLKCALCVMLYIQRISLEESRSCFHLRRKLILNLLSICCCCSVFWKPQKSKFWFHRYLISISWFKKWFSNQ